MRNFEDVSGIVVGGFSCKVCLIDPNGCIADYKIVSSESDFGSLADSMKKSILSQRLGNGEILKDRKDIIRAIHGAGQWELKIVNLK